MLLSSVAGARGASRRFLSRPLGMIAAAALAASAAGCSWVPSNGRSSLASTASGGSTVTFESIDGPPPEVFRKLVASLNDEAGARQIAVVSRSAPASYRVRGYVAALVERDKTIFAWVWDVYDADKRRTLRISGEEPAAPHRRRDANSAAGAWSAADEQVLRRMAKNGMEQIAGFLNSPEPPPPAAAPEPTLMTLVSGRYELPEAAGIVRVSGAQDQPLNGPAPVSAADVPLPPTPPKPAKTRSAGAAVATDGRSPGR